MARVALLAGLFGVPVFLLWIGHRLGDRSRVERGAFWGGVTGHSVGLLLALVALHYPPVLWTSRLRIAVVFWFILACATIGAMLGAARARAG
jgi:hypothetical protein